EGELERLPKVQREFRAAWIATVANINWPSKPGLSTDEQKLEATKLLDLLYKHNFNAVVFQVRPQCDAFYKSNLEPWSYYLTGEQGKAPDPYYDPLEFWIEEAHSRGLELHVWLNPYRAHHVSGGEVTEASVVKKHPELVVKLKSGYWWLDPSKSGTQDHSVNVVLDIVRRYNIDGVHFDDYFYPYPSYNDNEDFPDNDSWEEYKLSGGNLLRSDWRRESVNMFIKRLYGEIKKEKAYVKFGLSPFGIWRPHYPESILGFDQYDKLYADAKLWLNEGWIDYWTPQLYWTINQIPQSYPVLLGWWIGENKKNRHFWPGINIGRRRGEKGIDETINQIMITRGMLPENPGNVHWSIGSLVNNEDLVDAIFEGPYKKQALVPSSPWLDNQAPQEPIVNISEKADSLEIFWSHNNETDIYHWVVYFEHGDSWDYKILNRYDRSISLPAFTVNTTILRRKGTDQIESIDEILNPLNRIFVTVVDRVGNESKPTHVSISDISYTQAPTLEKILSDYASSLKVKKPVRKSPAVKLGIEVLVEDQIELIRNKRVGLITNPSAVGSDLRSDIDILASTPNVNLVALFGAEHGVRGAEHGRILLEGEPDPITGIPVYSLYGESYAPKKEWLEDIDVLIFDIQGVGSAWYTYKYSMSFAMEACAKAGIPFIVLDRPNPIGGRHVEGPFLPLRGMYRHQVPLRHGMTYGELAMMWNETEGYGADLTVIKMKGWRRDMTWDDTGLFWVLPSPNMGTVETALVYPGQCLFERMNIAEGRGTAKPFLMTGAPWINCEEAAEDLNSRNIPGVIFRPAYFIPRKLLDISNTRGKPWNKMCAGVEIMLTDYKAFKSVETALHIIDAYRKTNQDSLRWTPPETIKMLDEPGMTVERLVEECQKEVENFIEIRQNYLLYR
ncbi:exo-beta-N-acetylmuramidase NamZ domain-containing protein, partial [Bacteroidota bacterium]